MARKTTEKTAPPPAKARAKTTAKPSGTSTVAAPPAKARATTATKSSGKSAAAAPPAKSRAETAAAPKGKKAAAAAPPPPPAVVTLKHLADRIGEAHEMQPRQAQAVLNGVIALLVDHLKAGDKLRLKGLGILEVKNRPARTARNPATGATVQVAASKTISFRPAKDLKEAI